MLAGFQDSYVQIGHIGGAERSNQTFEATVNADIRIEVGNNITLLGPTASIEEGSAQIGHGGIGAFGSFGGDITIIGANDLNFTGGQSNRVYSQLGHGGALSNGDLSGDITIVKANDLNFTVDGGIFASSVQLGHGGYVTNGSRQGNIDLRDVGNVTFRSGGDAFGYSQLGHGGTDSGGNNTGDINVNSRGNVLFAGSNVEEYSQLGHGGLRDNRKS